MKKIIIDTNALMAISELKIDIFAEDYKVCDFPYQLAVLQGTLDELDKIMREQSGKDRQAAKLAKALLLAKKVVVIAEKGNVDDILVEHSLKADLVLTQDQGLKKRLRRPYLTIRQKKRVIMVL